MTALSFIAASACTLAAAIFDLRTGCIPDVLNRSAACAAFAIACAAGTLTSASAGAAAVAGTLLLIFVVTSTRGIGFGDVKLGVAIGAGCGPRLGLVALGTAFVLGAAYAVPMLLAGRAQRTDRIAFAPFLAAGTLVAAAAHGMGS